MVVLPVDANGNPLIWFIGSIPLEYLRHVFQALILPVWLLETTTLYPLPIKKILLSLYPRITLLSWMDQQPSISLKSVYGGFPIFRHQYILPNFGGCLLLPPLIFIYWFQQLFPIYRLLHLFKKCFQLRPWIYPCLFHFSLAMPKSNKILISVLHFRTSHAHLPPSNHHP